MKCVKGFCTIFLYMHWAYIGPFAHLQVPFLHVLGGIREQAHGINNKLKLLLHMTQTKTYL